MSRVQRHDGWGRSTKETWSQRSAKAIKTIVLVKMERTCEVSASWIILVGSFPSRQGPGMFLEIL